MVDSGSTRRGTAIAMRSLPQHVPSIPNASFLTTSGRILFSVFDASSAQESTISRHPPIP